jgi:hypothetical protein
MQMQRVYRQILCSLVRASQIYINNIQRDATIYSFFIAANLLYMFRVPKPPIIRSTLTVTTSPGTGHKSRYRGLV